MNMSVWEIQFEAKIVLVANESQNFDPAHDLLHLKRVVKTAKSLCVLEQAKTEVVIPAAWLHDFVVVPKDSPMRQQASQLSADAALNFLHEIGYPEQFHKEIAHAIAAHSFSAGLATETLEAKIVQDADRLDGLGAIGIARCFATSGMLKRVFYAENDPFCETREAQDMHFTVDHFYQKLFKTAETLKTPSARVEGQRRLKRMQEYLAALAIEIS